MELERELHAAGHRLVAADENWTMYQRYVRLDDLRTFPVNTTALDALIGFRLALRSPLARPID